MRSSSEISSDIRFRSGGSPPLRAGTRRAPLVLEDDGDGHRRLRGSSAAWSLLLDEGSTRCGRARALGSVTESMIFPMRCTPRPAGAALRRVAVAGRPGAPRAGRPSSPVVHELDPEVGPRVLEAQLDRAVRPPRCRRARATLVAASSTARATARATGSVEAGDLGHLAASRRARGRGRRSRSGARGRRRGPLRPRARHAVLRRRHPPRAGSSGSPPPPRGRCGRGG